jgi:hypothetical protein
MELLDQHIAFWKHEAGRERVSAKRRRAVEG